MEGTGQRSGATAVRSPPSVTVDKSRFHPLTRAEGVLSVIACYRKQPASAAGPHVLARRSSAAKSVLGGFEVAAPR
jgi:hypothetical protein